MIAVDASDARLLLRGLPHMGRLIKVGWFEQSQRRPLPGRRLL
jgi:hypothetical protein